MTDKANSIGNTPQARDDIFTAAEGAAVRLDVMANDLGGNAKSLYSVNQANPSTAASSGTTALGGTVSIVDGKVVYTASSTAIDALGAGETRTDTFTYTIQLGNGALSVATVSVTLTGTNDAPVVSGAVTGAATEGAAAVTLNGLANASDVDNGAVLSVVNVPANLPAGVTFDSASNSFTLDPAHPAYNHLGLGDTVTVTVNYGVSDGQLVTGAQASWTVTGTNDAPVAVADAFSVGENAVASLNLLLNDTDADDGAVLSLTGVAVGEGLGQVSVVDNRLQFQPGTAFDHLAGGQTQTVVVDYTAADEHGATSNGQATLTIVGVNDAPVVSGPVTGSATEGAGLHTLSALANASDVDDGDVLSLIGVPTLLPPGVSYDAATQSFTLDASHAAYNGLKEGQTTTVTVNYEVTDGEASRPGSVSWTLTGTNDAPQVFGQIDISVQEGGGNPLINGVGASDPEGDPLSVVLGQLPAGVSFDAATKLFTFNASDPAYNHLAAGATQQVVLTWGISDGSLVTERTATLTVHGTNDIAVIGGARTGSVLEDTTYTASGQLTVVDPDDGQAAFQAATGSNPLAGAYGSLTLTAQGAWTYTLNNSHPAVQALNGGQSLTDVITVMSVDGTTSQVTVTIGGKSDLPAGTITFEDLAHLGQAQIPDGYHGFNWDVPGGLNLYVLNGANYSNSGYQEGVTSGVMVAFTPYGNNPLHIRRTDGSDFDFEQVNITAAWNPTQTVTFQGYNNGVLVGAVTVQINNQGPTLVDVDWGDIDDLVISTPGAHLVFDDFLFG